jgi:hypothetical protein
MCLFLALRPIDILVLDHPYLQSPLFIGELRGRSEFLGSQQIWETQEKK